MGNCSAMPAQIVDLPVPGSPPTRTSRTRPASRWARARSSSRRACSGRRRVTLSGPDGGHLGPDLSPVGDVVMGQRRRPGVGRVLRVRGEERAGQVRATEVVEVHGQEGDVGQRVAETEIVVELDAVQDAGPVVEAEDVVGQQVAMTVTRSAACDPRLEQRRPAVEVAVGQAMHPADREVVEHVADLFGEHRRVGDPPCSGWRRCRLVDRPPGRGRRRHGTWRGHGRVPTAVVRRPRRGGSWC